MGKSLSDQPEPVTSNMNDYIDYWGKSKWKNDQVFRTHFWGKYGSLSLYYIDQEKRCIIYDEDIFFLNKYWYALVGNPDHPDVT